MHNDSTQEVILLSPPLMGKTSIVSAVATLKKAKLKYEGVEAEPGIMERKIWAEWAEGGSQFRVTTLAGAVWSMESWRAISNPGCKYILVMDGQAAASSRLIAELAIYLQMGLGPIAAVQITKVDLQASGVAFLDTDSILRALRFSEIPCFVSRIDQPLTQIAACCHVLGCALQSAAI